jgi:hypothetical protein
MLSLIDARFFPRIAGLLAALTLKKRLGYTNFIVSAIVSLPTRQLNNCPEYAFRCMRKVQKWVGPGEKIPIQ